MAARPGGRTGDGAAGTASAATVALAVVVALAGCGLAPSAPASTTTVTPAPVPTDTTTEAPGETLLPGLTADRVVDAGALAAAHRERLANRSVTVTVERRATRSNGSVVGRVEAVARHGANRSRFYLRDAFGPSRVGTGVRLVERWSDGVTQFTRVAYDDGSVWYGADPATPRDPLAVEPALAAIGGVDVTARGDAYRVAARSFDGRPPFVPLAVENLSLTAVVDREGLVRELTTRYERSVDDGSVRVVVRVRYRRVGATTVPRPDWADEARAATNATATATATGATADPGAGHGGRASPGTHRDGGRRSAGTARRVTVRRGETEHTR